MLREKAVHFPAKHRSVLAPIFVLVRIVQKKIEN